MIIGRREYANVGIVITALCFVTAIAGLLYFQFAPNPVQEVYTEVVSGSFEKFNSGLGWIHLEGHPLTYTVSGSYAKHFAAADFRRDIRPGTRLRLVVNRHERYKPRRPLMNPHIKLVAAYAVAGDSDVYLSVSDSHRAMAAANGWALFCAAIFLGFGLLSLYATFTEAKHLMDTRRFNKIDDGFDVLDLTACFEFKTEGSIGFMLCSPGDTPDKLIHRGNITVHHPCAGPVRAQMYVHCPSKYEQQEHLREIIDRTLTALAIPVDETFAADFIYTRKVIRIINESSG